MRKFLDASLFAVVVLIGVLAVSDGWMTCDSRRDPLWVVPGQKVIHLSTGEVGHISETEPFTVSLPSGVLRCQPIDVAPVQVER